MLAYTKSKGLTLTQQGNLMRQTAFFRFGAFVYAYRLAIIITWLVIILGCLPFLPHVMTPFQSTGFVDEQSPSAKTEQILNKEMGYNNDELIILYHSKTLKATDPKFISTLKESLKELKNYPIKHKIIYPDINKAQISTDKHTAYVVILFDGTETMSPEQLTEFKRLLQTPKDMTMKLGGESIFINGINEQTEKDLLNADIIAAPISIVVLIVVFGSLVSALLPVILGGGCAVIILTILYALGHLFSLSVFTINIALLLGICLSLDYSLFIVSRFKEELIQQKNVSDAISVTLDTAGKAVFFSGLAVFVSLSALLLFPVNVLFSVGVGGLTAVFSAVIIAIVVLPAVLGVLKARINLIPIRLFRQKTQHVSVWRRIAETVVKRPFLFFIAILLTLLLLGSPFLKVNFGVSDINILPKHAQISQFFDAYSESFDEQELTPITLVISTEQGDILSSNNIEKIYKLSDKIKQNQFVKKMRSIVDTDPQLTLEQYKMIYGSEKFLKDPRVQALLKSTTKKQFTVITVISKYDANAEQTATLIKNLREINPGTGLVLNATGEPVNNVDVLKSIAHIFPYAITWIIVLTYLILLVLLRSVFLPFKAILMNILSLCATYGILVFIFQEGHLHQLLNFTPQGMLDISLLVIIFCALFGFSMDYEVFLLTRIQEAYQKSKNNDQSIVYGIDHSSRIITSAAVIVIVTCGSFMVAEVLMVKEFGLGIAVAIFVDAFLVRTIFVPATMAMIKEWNWYLPKWLNRILPKL